MKHKFVIICIIIISIVIAFSPLVSFSQFSFTKQVLNDYTPGFIDIGDFDLDGDFDILGSGIANINCNNYVYLLENDNGLYNYIPIDTLSEGILSAKFCNLNNDKYLDVAVCVLKKGIYGFSFNKKVKKWENKLLISPKVGCSIIGFESFDFNNDKVTDFIVYCAPRGIWIYENNKKAGFDQIQIDENLTRPGNVSIKKNSNNEFQLLVSSMTENLIIEYLFRDGKKFNTKIIDNNIETPSSVIYKLDSDNNDKENILACSFKHGEVFGYRSRKDEETNKNLIFQSLKEPLKIDYADLNNDNISEILICYKNSNIYFLKNDYLNTIASYRLDDKKVKSFFFKIFDLDNDKDLDIISCTTSGIVIYFNNTTDSLYYPENVVFPDKINTYRNKIEYQEKCKIKEIKFKEWDSWNIKLDSLYLDYKELMKTPPFYSWTDFYDDNGKLINRKTCSLIGDRIVNVNYIYDKNNNLISENHKNSLVTDHIYYNYNKEGRLETKTNYSPYGQIEKENYKYNEDTIFVKTINEDINIEEIIILNVDYINDQNPNLPIQIYDEIGILIINPTNLNNYFIIKEFDDCYNNTLRIQYYKDTKYVFNIIKYDIEYW